VTLARGAKNLAEVAQQEQAQREGTQQTAADVKRKIIEFYLWMLRQGYDEETAKNRAYLIKRLNDLNANINDPESIKELLAKQKWGDGYKANFVEAYNSLLEMQDLKWNPPHYRRPQTLSFIPSETELDQLIAAAGKITGTFLQGLKDTGADPGELGAVRWTDIDRERKTVRINFPVKGHDARILRVSDKFLDRISVLPKKGERLFRSKRLIANFWVQRKTIARKLSNPRLLQVHFTTFRHWKGTVEYHRTRDILYVKKLLGHKCIQSTLVYIDYEKAVFDSPTQEEFTAKVAENAQEACKLVEVGFDYVTGDYNDGGKIFRKRK
jgi:integrase